MDKKDKKLDFRPRKLVAGLCYLALVGVVLYGMTDHVYDGFGKAVPWLIIVLFAFMAVVRLSECVPEYSVITLVKNLIAGREEEE